MSKHPDFMSAQWRKSVHSDTGGCVEVAYVAGLVGVRDTKDKGTGPILTFTEREWTAFLCGAADGEFSLASLGE